MRWTRTGLGDTDGLRTLGGRLVVLGGDSVHGYDIDHGTTLWQRPGRFVDAVDYGGVSLLLSGSAVTAIDSSGGTSARWTLTLPLDDSARLLPGSGQLWAIGSHDRALAGTWLGPTSPGPL